MVCSVDPISLGILKRPGDAGVDIVVEGQSLGTPLLYGGPYLGIMACREKFVRRLPGRIAGQTVDQHGNRCWVLTLQTREQHISVARKQPVTSVQIRGLFALRAAIYLSVMGPSGMRDVANLCLQKAHYAQQQLTSLDRFEAVTDQPFFKEFVVRDKHGDVSGLLEKAEDFQYSSRCPPREMVSTI